MKFIFLANFLVIFVSSQDASDPCDYLYPDYENYDYNEVVAYQACVNKCEGKCNLEKFEDETCAEKCHIDKLPKESLQVILGSDNVKECCPNYDFAFDQTNDCGDLGLKCGKLNQNKPDLPPNPRPCPNHCTTKLSEHFNEDNVKIDADGKLTLVNPPDALKDAKIENYCAAKKCHSGKGWKTSFEICICPHQDHLKEIDKKMGSSKPRRCCPNSLLTIPDGKNMTCPTDPIADPDLHCSWEPFQSFDLKVHSDKIEIVKYGEPSKFINFNDPEYCVGATWTKQMSEAGAHKNPIKAQIFTCRDPCHGKKPCVRLCDNGHDMKKLPNSTDPYLLKLRDLLGNSEDHMEKASHLERRCNRRSHTRKYLSEKDKRQDQFEFKKEGDEIVLYSPWQGKTYQANEFCLNFNASSVQAEICTKDINAKKFDWYPKILMVSCFFLAVTLAVYMFVPNIMKKDSDFYPRLMTHYTASLLLAFIILAINQEIRLNANKPMLCHVFAYGQQYFLLVAFGFMSMMSYEILQQLKGFASNRTRFFKEKVVAYLVPLVISLITLFVELFADRRAIFKPRFTETSCFFSGNTSKIIWLYTPIALSLFFSIWNFILTVRAVMAVDKETSRFTQRSDSSSSFVETACCGRRTLQKDRFYMFLKHFIGIGILWTFEVISGILDEHVPEQVWYVTDFLNMLQGLYIFIIFVCKRNILEAILKCFGYDLNKSKASKALPLLPMNKTSKRLQETTNSMSDNHRSNLFTEQTAVH